MNLELSGPYEALRAEVRDFLASHWRPEIRGDRAAEKRFRADAVARGYLYRRMPKALGGSECGAHPIAEMIIAQEFTRAGAVREVPGVGSALVAPTLLECGAPWQRERFIPPILSGDELWAQGYSEPDSGSDLASLRTRATLDGDHWVIEGRKIWTSYADTARFMFALVRTNDAPRHAGLSYLLLPLDQEAIQIRPIPQMNGAATFCEVTFDGARTPKDWIVGSEGEGWRIANATLRHERDFVGAAQESQVLLDDLISLARSRTIAGAPAIGNAHVRQRLARLAGFVEAHLCSGLYQTTQASMGRPAGLPGLLNKITSTNILHEAAAIAADLLNEDALAPPERESGGARSAEQWSEQGMRAMSRSIAGGASNIQRNIIAERGLGLPRA